MSTAGSVQHSFQIPLVKVDEERRLVIGRAAAEEPDRAREILDYASARPAFQKWSDETFEASNGLSKGNVRAMHDPKRVAGVLTDIAFDDDKKCIDVVAKIVDDGEWRKVLAGAYTGFSVGGGYASRWADPSGLKRYTPLVNEISLVDRPCIPSAKFIELHKADGQIEQLELRGTKIASFAERWAGRPLSFAERLAKGWGEPLPSEKELRASVARGERRGSNARKAIGNALCPTCGQPKASTGNLSKGWGEPLPSEKELRASVARGERWGSNARKAIGNALCPTCGQPKASTGNLSKGWGEPLPSEKDLRASVARGERWGSNARKAIGNALCPTCGQPKASTGNLSKALLLAPPLPSEKDLSAFVARGERWGSNARKAIGNALCPTCGQPKASTGNLSKGWGEPLPSEKDLRASVARGERWGSNARKAIGNALCPTCGQPKAPKAQAST